MNTEISARLALPFSFFFEKRQCFVGNFEYHEAYAKSRAEETRETFETSKERQKILQGRVTHELTRMGNAKTQNALDRALKSQNPRAQLSALLSQVSREAAFFKERMWGNSFLDSSNDYEEGYESSLLQMKKIQIILSFIPAPALAQKTPKRSTTSGGARRITAERESTAPKTAAAGVIISEIGGTGEGTAGVVDSQGNKEVPPPALGGTPRAGAGETSEGRTKEPAAAEAVQIMKDRMEALSDDKEKAFLQRHKDRIKSFETNNKGRVTELVFKKDNTPVLTFDENDFQDFNQLTILDLGNNTLASLQKLPNSLEKLFATYGKSGDMVFESLGNEIQKKEEGHSYIDMSALRKRGDNLLVQYRVKEGNLELNMMEQEKELEAVIKAFSLKKNIADDSGEGVNLQFSAKPFFENGVLQKIHIYEDTLVHEVVFEIPLDKLNLHGKDTDVRSIDLGSFLYNNHGALWPDILQKISNEGLNSFSGVGSGNHTS